MEKKICKKGDCDDDDDDDDVNSKKITQLFTAYFFRKTI
jgi:hypothetical protein